jgi:competence protein ComEA
MGWGANERKLLAFLAIVLAIGLSWRASSTIRPEADPLPSLLLDANSAPLEVLIALPGLGPALAGRIVEAREVAPFRSLDDLDRRVKGIGPAKVSAIRPFLRFDPAPASPPVPQG